MDINREMDIFVGLLMNVVSILSFVDDFFLGFWVDLVEIVVVLNGIFDYIGFFEGFFLGGEDLIIL